MSKKDGQDRKYIHEICVKAVPTSFTYVHLDWTWRNGTQEDFDALAKVCLALKAPWTSEETGQRLRGVLIAFARTSPEMFDHLYGKTGSLLPSPKALLWVAANKILGSYWRFIRTPSKPVVKQKKQLAFAENTTCVVSVKTKTGLFLHQSGICSSVSRNFEDMTARHPRKFYTFFTLRFPAIAIEEVEAMQKAQFRVIHEALSLLWTKDCRAVLYVFPSKSVSGSAAKTLRNLPESFTVRQAVEIYCLSMYITEEQAIVDSILLWS